MGLLRLEEEKVDKPVDALDRMISKGIYLDRGRCPKPGAILERMTDKDRELLKQLKSDDIKNIRAYWLE